MTNESPAQPKGWIGGVISALPPAFLALACLNIGMLYFVLKTVEGQNEQRLQILTKVIDACLNK